MHQKLIDFLKLKEIENGGPVLSEHVIFGSLRGSRLYNTDDGDSDYDFGAVTIMPEDYIIGLSRFDYSKLNGGKNGMTTAGDMDAEVYHYDCFIDRLIKGETNTVEMLFAPSDKQIYVQPIFVPLLEAKDLFISQNLIRHYTGLIFSHLNQAGGKLKNVEKTERVERIQRFSYETKDMMKAIMYLRISIEFLEHAVLNFHREDREELLQIKNGAFKTLEEARAYANDLMNKRNKLFETSSLSKYPDNDKLNTFMKSYNRMILSQYIKL